MARPLEIPGIIGALASKLGLQALADHMSTALAQTHPGTLRKWGKNQLRTPGPAGALLAKLAEEHGVQPILYESKNLPTAYVASLPEGWVLFPMAVGGWEQRHSFMGFTEGLTLADRGILLCARHHGWPW